mmetsp:Transcript_117133/g.175027  ORF Transcript_117133/g.175027 Transcript_117133/m.175027 type:complete len:216 (+) Transcript_117133:87-734(+)
MMLQQKGLVAWVLCASTRPASGIELRGIDPTVFNFISDLTGIAIQLIFSLCLAGCYALFVSRHIAADNTVPLKALGNIPNDFATAIMTARTMSWSMPIFAFATLLAINQFSHAVADLGLSFDPSVAEGPLDSVLSLDTFSRNKAIIVEAVGDPYNQRTHPSLAAALDDETLPEDEREAYNKQARQVMTFIYAVDNVAQGASPFLHRDSLNAAEKG